MRLTLALVVEGPTGKYSLTIVENQPEIAAGFHPLPRLVPAYDRKRVEQRQIIRAASN